MSHRTSILATLLLVVASGSASAADVVTNPLGMQLVRLPAGEFAMGSPVTEKGRRKDEPQRRVRLTRDFWIGRHEVTRGQFRRFVDATKYVTECERNKLGGYGYDAATNTLSGRDPKYTWRFTGFEQTDEHPVVNVSWNDAVAFCTWLTKEFGPGGSGYIAGPARPGRYRLPTEAEWEYACRGGTTTAFANGDDSEAVVEIGNIVDAEADKLFPDRLEVKRSDGFVFTAPVGSFQPNDFGIFDMHGNVWEWTGDNFGPPPEANSGESLVDPRGPETARDKVVRGGDWYHDWSYARSAQRTNISPWLCRRHAGFRVVRETATSSAEDRRQQ